MRHSAAGALVALALIITPSTAHSWVEQIMVISSNGSFTGNPGYARNNTMRTVPGFSDPLMVHILPGQGQPSIEERQAPAASAAMPPTSTATAFSDTMSILPTDPMCKKTQQTMTQSNGSPRLQAAPGDNIALRYQENGHVTLPQNQPGKPANRGTVYIYGTTQPKTNETFLDIFKQWTMNGTGGDKRGVLLATQPFDDGQCYQVNSGNISTERQKQYPHTPNQLMGANLWCQNDIALPADAPSGKPYTLYWVWDWPTAPGVDPSLPNGKAEIYTTCMDIDITGTKARRDLEERQAPAASAASGANLNIMAVPKYMKELATPNAQSAQSVQATPALSPAASAASSPAAAAPAAPAATASASPESAAGVVLETSDAQAASEFISYLETAVTAADPSAAKLLASDMATVTVTAPAQTVTVTETPCASSAAMAGQQSIVTISSTTSSTMQTVYAASTPVQPAAQAPSQAPAASPSTHAQASAQAPAQSPAASPSTTAQAAAQAPAQSPAAKSSSAVLPPPVLNLQAPVTSGAPPPTSAAAPAASSHASSPASSAAAAGAPPLAASPAASAQIPGSPTAPTTETPPAGAPSAPAAAATPSPPSAAAPAAASPASSSIPAGVFPSGVVAPSGGMQYVNSLSFTGTASAVSAAPTGSGSASPAAAPKGCSVKKACKLKKRSLLLSGHARFH